MLENTIRETKIHNTYNNIENRDINNLFGNGSNTHVVLFYSRIRLDKSAYECV